MKKVVAGNKKKKTEANAGKTSTVHIIIYILAIHARMAMHINSKAKCDCDGYAMHSQENSQLTALLYFSNRFNVHIEPNPFFHCTENAL